MRKVKLTKITAASTILALTLSATACMDDAGNPGGSLVKSEVTIDIDSSFNVKGRSVEYTEFNSKNRALMLGHLNVPEYGDLDCSFVSQLLAGSEIDIPDSISTDQISGLRLRFMMTNGAFTGDSLAPQRVDVYRLTKPLPTDINNQFNPEGYYDPTPLASRSYTASALGMPTAVYNLSYRCINLDLPVESGRKIYEQYRKNPEIFQWPAELAKVFPGIYAKNVFGDGLVVDIGNTEFILYYNYTKRVNKVVDGTVVSVDSLMNDSTTVFTISPEVLSSNNMRLQASNSIKQRVTNGENVILSPGGYNLQITFPTADIVRRYVESEHNLAVVNSLSFQLPASAISNDYGIKTPNNLLLIKTAKMKEFFEEGKTPQGYVGEETDTDAFWASYDDENECYTFSAMRPYILDMLKKDTITSEDCEFTLIPVEIRLESWGSSYESKQFVSSCLPYVTRPSMCIADLENAKIKFVFSRQVIE